MSTRGGELVTTNEPTVFTEPLLDALVVENSQGDRRLPNPAGADEGDWREAFCETNDLLN